MLTIDQHNYYEFYWSCTEPDKNAQHAYNMKEILTTFTKIGESYLQNVSKGSDLHVWVNH